MRTILAILLGGFVAGSLYILSTVADIVPRGGSAKSVLQYIASGILGESALQGGWTTAIFGLALHFAMATIMAAAFVVAARRLPILVERPWSSGILYGAVLYVAMTFVVGPLSAAPRWHVGGGWAMIGGLLAHSFYVGLPIAAIARRLRQHKRQRKTYGAII